MSNIITIQKRYTKVKVIGFRMLQASNAGPLCAITIR